jgi:hypothetical protein
MFVLLLGRWLGGIIRHERTPSPPPRIRPTTSNIPTDDESNQNLVYLVEEISPTTSRHTNESHSIDSDTADMIADSCYDTPASSPVQNTRNFFDNSFQIPLFDYLCEEETGELDESYFDTSNCLPQSTSCDLKFEKNNNCAEFVHKECLISDYEIAEICVLSIQSVFCDSEFKLVDQIDFNEAIWPVPSHETVDKSADEPSDMETSIDLNLENVSQDEFGALITNLLNQHCGATFDANQSIHMELLEEDQDVHPKTCSLSLASSSEYDSDSLDSSTSSSSCQSNIEVEAAL